MSSDFITIETQGPNSQPFPVPAYPSLHLNVYQFVSTQNCQPIFSLYFRHPSMTCNTKQVYCDRKRYVTGMPSLMLSIPLCYTKHQGNTCISSVQLTLLIVLINLYKPNSNYSTTSFNIQKFYMVLALRLNVCIDFYLAKHQRIGFLQLRWRVFTVRYALSPYIKHTILVLKWLMVLMRQHVATNRGHIQATKIINSINITIATIRVTLQIYTVQDICIVVLLL
jgi:hypothetical protein